MVAALTGNPVIMTSGIGGDFALILLKTFVATIYVVFFYMLLAYAAGTIFQSPAAGIGIGIGFSIGQQVLFGIFTALHGPWKVIADHFPASYAGSLPERLASESGSSFGSSTVGTPGVVESIIGLGIYIVALVVLTMIIVQKRDVSA